MVQYGSTYISSTGAGWDKMGSRYRLCVVVAHGASGRVSMLDSNRIRSKSLTTLYYRNSIFS